MKQSLIACTLLFLISAASGQIAGISGSKLNSVCVDVVDHHKIEFEPSFSVSSQSRFWNQKSKLSNIYSNGDSIGYSSDLYLRFTYGLFDKIEIGVTVPANMSSGSFGLRYVIKQENKLGVAIIAGLNSPFGNSTYDKKNYTEETTSQFGLGGVFSYQFNERFSVDANAQYSNFINKPSSNRGASIYIGADAGYYLFEGTLQVISGLGYQFHDYDVQDQFLLTFYPGVTIETGKNYIVILSAPFDIHGKNTPKSVGFSFALTLTFD